MTTEPVPPTPTLAVDRHFDGDNCGNPDHDSIMERWYERAYRRIAALSDPFGGINVLKLSWAIDQHAVALGRDEPIHEEGTCSTDCAADIAGRYAYFVAEDMSR